MSQYKRQFVDSANAELEELKDEWRTPDSLFDPLDDLFSFTIDAAATQQNTKVDQYFNDGLTQSWKGHNVFVNPPFSNGRYGDWVDKAVQEYRENLVTIAMILPFKSETRAFSGVWDYARYLILPRERVAFDFPFGYIPKENEKSNATFVSCVAIFKPLPLGRINDLLALERIGRLIDLQAGLFSRSFNIK